VLAKVRAWTTAVAQMGPREAAGTLLINDSLGLLTSTRIHAVTATDDTGRRFDFSRARIETERRGVVQRLSGWAGASDAPEWLS
jgi:hypothetical protein